ncbi:hypothetical protein GCM10009616_12280 [Microlunatus lacustris]
MAPNRARDRRWHEVAVPGADIEQGGSAPEQKLPAPTTVGVWAIVLVPVPVTALLAGLLGWTTRVSTAQTCWPTEPTCGAGPGGVTVVASHRRCRRARCARRAASE